MPVVAFDLIELDLYNRYQPTKKNTLDAYVKRFVLAETHDAELLQSDDSLSIAKILIQKLYLSRSKLRHFKFLIDMRQLWVNEIID